MYSNAFAMCSELVKYRFFLWHFKCRSMRFLSEITNMLYHLLRSFDIEVSASRAIYSNGQIYSTQSFTTTHYTHTQAPAPDVYAFYLFIREDQQNDSHHSVRFN